MAWLLEFAQQTACCKGSYMSLDVETPNDLDASADTWFEDYALPDDETQIDEYDITAVPNDFNITTIFSFLESGAVTIPAFQRNYVWDLKRASKLIESIIIGLPVPQVFLYEESRNKFLVIDGQQRLMSIYYFMKQRFPRKEKRVELRRIFDEHGRIPADVLSDDAYFTKFNLQLPEKMPGLPNRFKGRTYLTLEEYKTQFDLRTIRNIIVKQNMPQDDDSSIYECQGAPKTGSPAPLMTLKGRTCRAGQGRVFSSDGAPAGGAGRSLLGRTFAV